MFDEIGIPLINPPYFFLFHYPFRSSPRTSAGPDCLLGRQESCFVLRAAVPAMYVNMWRTGRRLPGGADSFPGAAREASANEEVWCWNHEGWGKEMPAVAVRGSWRMPPALGDPPWEHKRLVDETVCRQGGWKILMHHATRRYTAIILFSSLFAINVLQGFP